MYFYSTTLSQGLGVKVRFPLIIISFKSYIFFDSSDYLGGLDTSLVYFYTLEIKYPVKYCSVPKYCKVPSTVAYQSTVKYQVL